MTVQQPLADPQIRPATDSDAGSIAELYLASFKATYDFPLAHTDEQVRRWIAGVVIPSREVWVAASTEGLIVGMMVLDDHMLDQLYVAPGETGKGLGSRFLDLAKGRSPAGIDLYTFQVNAYARQFYERRGFVEVERGDGSTNEERQPDVRYAWRPSIGPADIEFAVGHVAAFNAAVELGRFDQFLRRYADDAVLRFENVPGAGTLEFTGRAAIAAAYAEQSPDDQIDIAGEITEDGLIVVIPFAWRRDGGRGVMRAERQGATITRMTVAFR